MGKLLGIALLLFATNGQAKPISIMAYNVENLFDTQFDVGTDDYTWLPLSLKKQMPEHAAYCASMPEGMYKQECLTVNWTYNLYRQKLNNLSDVITSFDSHGLGPDVLIMEEVENLHVLKDLANLGLTGLGYRQAVLVEGDDSRGIDVGLITKYPVVGVKRHSVYLNGKKLNTRGILQVVINVRGKKLVVFGNHWPSQNNPPAERVVHAQLLSQLTAATTADLIVSVGDFNTTPDDNPHPYSYLKNMYDAEAVARQLNVPLNPGTHFYKKEWQSLDKIFVHKNSRVLPNWKSFRIGVQPWMMGADGGPQRFDRVKGTGYSDHLPVMIRADLDTIHPIQKRYAPRKNFYRH